MNARTHARALLLAGAAWSWSGCGPLWTETFEAHTDARLVIPLGADDDCAGASAPGGEPAPDGSVVTWSHAQDGGACVIHATWRGTLIDMADVRAKTEQQLLDEGLDPADVDITITAVQPEVERVSLRDGARGPELRIDGGALEYTATISVPDAGDVVSLANGDVMVSPSSALVSVANDAYAEAASLEGHGATVARISLAHASRVAEAAQPVLRIDFTVHVTGEARLSTRAEPRAGSHRTKR